MYKTNVPTFHYTESFHAIPDESILSRPRSFPVSQLAPRRSSHRTHSSANYHRMPTHHSLPRELRQYPIIPYSGYRCALPYPRLQIRQPSTRPQHSPPIRAKRICATKPISRAHVRCLRERSHFRRRYSAIQILRQLVQSFTRPTQSRSTPYIRRSCPVQYAASPASLPLLSGLRYGPSPAR
jgi:hypothetical protein